MDGFEVLDEFSNEELEVLVKLILDKGALTETLTGSEEYEKYKPNHKLYVNRIKKNSLTSLRILLPGCSEGMVFPIVKC